ncbi:type II toxin-antitoxin system RelE/ParE family toxin [Dyadobacter chenwenxiniae]|uniref:Type II toxin-antitoxin system RelE/ParE family toxin n=1 Tax=Dyadobacter chenwenxiniae TaxID=2906456 RepID=A0A9X1TBY3_9BACT|nr:type II toxin-antitoxin system RelE/ParE family toxin [Dyadobacter chenwenxiniae]MCF0060341.1 type II toxin-antitoxin system RelE/ParE family toxin [Dyadobacter chenwenxiniae]UON86074.1 type II toxin-antitoxin system RelE/ParE family toxin [Dyadobacter chenwenxiniae]
MELVFEKAFVKELKRCPDYIQRQGAIVLNTIRAVEHIMDIPDCSLIQGKGNNAYYRIHVGGYRIGLKYHEGTIKIVSIITMQSRGDIY